MDTQDHQSIQPENRTNELAKETGIIIKRIFATVSIILGISPIILLSIFWVHKPETSFLFLFFCVFLGLMAIISGVAALCIKVNKVIKEKIVPHTVVIIMASIGIFLGILPFAYGCLIFYFLITGQMDIGG